MKYIVILVIILSSTLSFAKSKTVLEGKTFITTVVKEESEDVKTDYTWKTSDGKVYYIYATKNGAYYIIKTSKRTGKKYKHYLPKEITNQIK